MTLRKSILLTGIKRHFSAAILARGADLLRKGKVGDIHRYEIDGDCYEYVAGVIGSSGDNYETSIIFLENQISSKCDCPYGFNCKHGAALALAVVETIAAQDETGGQNTLETWLNTLKSKRAGSQTGGGMTTAQQDWHAFYLIDTTNALQPILVPVMRYRKKTGDWGRLDQLAFYKVQQFTGQNTHDKAAWSLMNLLPERNHRLSNYQFFEGHLLLEDAGFLLLQHALRSGRALDMHSMQPLLAGESRQLAFGMDRGRGRASA